MMRRTPDCCAILNDWMVLDEFVIECGLQCIG